MPTWEEIDAAHPTRGVALSRIPEPVSTPAVYADAVPVEHDDTLRGRIQGERDRAYRNAQADSGSQYYDGMAHAFDLVLELTKEDK